MQKQERLQKILSRAGLGSRREMERWIEQGLVQCNGIVAKIGDVASEKDEILVKGKPISNPLAKLAKTRVLIYHKPIGEICSTSDPKHNKTVFDSLPTINNGRWIQVGRLDISTSGLLIFTNNGFLANKLMHPSSQLEREYAVRVRGEVDHNTINRLLQGVTLEDGKAAFKSIRFQGGEGSNGWYHVVLTEGRNREVRRLWSSQNCEVSRLIRIRFGPIVLPKYLSRGKFEELDETKIHALYDKLPKKNDR